jgi:peptidoglycan/xylan/chitin deacetylase (PgdA/CDA1 family)
VGFRIPLAAAVAALLVGPVATTMSLAADERTVDVPILMYHRIDYLRPGLPEITRGLTVDPRDFNQQMLWVKRHGYHTLTQRQLLGALRDGRPLPPKPLLITFDDGYRDVLGKASPILHRLHLRATAYVITSRLGGPDPSFLTVPQLRILERRGIEIGSHTVDHVKLTTASDGEALYELTASKWSLELALGHPVRWFAYPVGAYDPHVIGLVAQAGYALAVTETPGTCQSSASPLELKRLEVLDTTGVQGVASMLRSAGC